jgi:hypothetical protein
MKSARRGAWLAACESLESLNQKVPNQPCVWRNIAILRGWVGQESHAAEAWRQYATLPGVSTDDAVEAEALAAMLAEPAGEGMIDVVRLSYGVPDTDRLMEFLLSDRRCEEMPVNLSELAEEGEPPPKGAFHLLDREMPVSLDTVASVQDLPTITGEAYLYGRQTDRPARLEVVLERNSQFDQNKQGIATLLGERVGSPEKEEVIEQVSRLRAETSLKRRFPQQPAMDRAMELMSEHRREVYLQRWPEVPLNVFNGKTARQAAQEPKLRIRVSAAILNLELANEESRANSDFDFNELRRELGIPDRVTTPLDRPVAELSLVRFGRLDYAKLSDEELLTAYQRLMMLGYRTGLYACGREVIARPSLSDKLDVANVLQVLARLAPDSDAALQFIDMGRQLATARGHSPAEWYLHELQARLDRFEAEESNRLIQLIATRYGREPGVNEALYTLLVRHGLINPDGTPVQAPGAAPGAAPAAATAASSPLWTPESAATAPKGESKLWLPGS